MRSLLGGKKQNGYTIVEIMIVLAVSGVMFLIAAQFINGKQSTTAFNQGVNEMASRIQDIIEQVTDGQYSDVPIDCTYDGATHVNPGGTSNQGKNSQCVFLGKVIHFWPHNRGAGAYDVFSIAGGRVNTSDIEVVDLPTADPEVINFLDASYDVPQGLQIGNIVVTNADGTPATPSYEIAFLQSLGTLDANNNVVNSGSNIIVFYVDTVGSNDTTGHAKTAIEGGTTHLTRAGTYRICLTDNNRWAILSLGNNDTLNGNTGGQLSVDARNYGRARPAIC